jgi:hypothetical protein
MNYEAYKTVNKVLKISSSPTAPKAAGYILYKLKDREVYILYCDSG